MSILDCENPLVLNPELASLIGLNESIIVQQVYYWIKLNEEKNTNFHDGRFWTYNTYDRWQEQFPFWSVKTIKRTIKKLENSGILISGNYNQLPLDKTKWYTIDFDVINKLQEYQNQKSNSDFRLGQSVPMDGSSCPHASGQSVPSNTRDYTKTNTETSYNVNGAIQEESLDTLGFASDFGTGEYNKESFNVGIIKKEVIAACRNCGVTEQYDIENAVCVVLYYLESFRKVFRENHPFISQKAMNGVIERFFAGSDIVDCDKEFYYALIDQHFDTIYDNCDYNICHFMTDGIRQNRAYKLGINA